MVEIKITYENDLHCTAIHGPSGMTMTTDAPVDNHGRGESFSPTDLLATSLGTCMATIMGIYAKQHEIDLGKMAVRVEKWMVESPRRIGKLVVEFRMPRSLTDRQRQALERAALTCPVHRSLHPDIEIPLTFLYDLD